MYVKKRRHVSKEADKRDVYRTQKKPIKEADLLRHSSLEEYALFRYSRSPLT